MFTQADLSALLSASPRLGVSIYLPTHLLGSEVRQDPIRLKNLTGQARKELVAAGLSPVQTEAFLAPAVKLISDYAFWQHQDQGLALFLDGGEARVHKLPFPVVEQVVVGSGFQIRPLLVMFSGAGAFDVLTITAGKVRLFRSNRFDVIEDENHGLPESMDRESDELDYENPVQASPVARPHTGSIDISNAQVYGDSPADWNKARLVRYVHKVSTAVDARSAVHPMPLVLVADAEIGGHFQKFSNLGPLLISVVEGNPEAMDRQQLHEATYSTIASHLDADRTAALKRFQALQGHGDRHAASGIEEVLRAAHQARVDTLLIAQDVSVWGHYDKASDQVVIDPSNGATGQDLLVSAAEQTLQHGGRVHQLDSGEADSEELVAAILRY